LGTSHPWIEGDEGPSIDTHDILQYPHDRNKLLVIGRVITEIYELNTVDGAVKLQRGVSFGVE
jgi:hypothetical protein